MGTSPALHVILDPELVKTIAETLHRELLQGFSAGYPVLTQLLRRYFSLDDIAQIKQSGTIPLPTDIEERIWKSEVLTALERKIELTGVMYDVDEMLLSLLHEQLGSKLDLAVAAEEAGDSGITDELGNKVIGRMTPAPKQDLPTQQEPPWPNIL